MNTPKSRKLEPDGIDCAEAEEMAMPEKSGLTAEFRQKPCFFVQNNLVERVVIPVAEYARAYGYALEDRSSTSDFDAGDCGINWSVYGPVLPYGSVQFIRALYDEPALSQYVHYDEESFATSECVARLGNHMLNFAGYLVKAADVPEIVGNSPRHVRPDKQGKAFNAAVFTAESWRKMVEERALAPDLLCWVSVVRKINREWRCWVVGGEVVESSQYREAAGLALNRSAPEAVTTFATQIAKQWLPAPCVVLDVAETDSGLKVIEFNSIHTSGWYAADVPRVLEAWLRWSERYFRNSVQGFSDEDWELAQLLYGDDAIIVGRGISVKGRYFNFAPSKRDDQALTLMVEQDCYPSKSEGHPNEIIVERLIEYIPDHPNRRAALRMSIVKGITHKLKTDLARRRFRQLAARKMPDEEVSNGR